MEKVPGNPLSVSVPRLWVHGSAPSVSSPRGLSSPSSALTNISIHTLASGQESPKTSFNRVVSKGFEGRAVDDVTGNVFERPTLVRSSSQDLLKMEQRTLNQRLNHTLHTSNWNPIKERLAALQTPGLQVTEDGRGRIKELLVKGSPCKVGRILGQGAIKKVCALEEGAADIIDRYVLACIDMGEVLMKTSSLKSSLEGTVQEIEIAHKLRQTIPNSNILVPAEIALVEREGSYPHLYLLLEKANGENLKKIMEDPAITETKPQFVYKLIIDSLEGLRDVNEAGILHNDFRESNILTRTTTNGSLQAVVGDFGQAASIDEFQKNPSCLTNISQSAADPILASLYSLAESILDLPQRDQLIEKLKNGDLQGAKALLPRENAAQYVGKLPLYHQLLNNPKKAEVWSAGLMMYRTVTNQDPSYYYQNFDTNGPVRSRKELQELLLDFQPSMFEEQIPDSRLPSYQDSPFSIMKKCVSLNPAHRPTLDELIHNLKKAKKNQLSLGVPPDLDSPTLMPPKLAELKGTGAVNRTRLAQTIDHWKWCLNNYTNGLHDDDGNEVIAPDHTKADQANKEIRKLERFLHSL